MTLTPELYYLALTAFATALMWIPYVLARMVTRGLWGAMANPSPTHKPLPAWAQRAQAAHANAIENLAVFAPLVLIAAVAGIRTAETLFAVKLYLFARLLHYVVYTAGIPVIRTLAFLAGLVGVVIYFTAIIAHMA